MYAVILAGGGGTRLWPLSTPERPKPFLPLLGERTLLQLTADRLAGLVDDDAIFVVTDQRYASLAGGQLPAATVVEEPLGRNTAAAVALAALAIERPDDEVMAVLPADQRISDTAGYARVLRIAAERLAAGAFGIEAPLVTLGVRPTYPATGFGYVRPVVDRAGQVDGLPASPVERFEEKPTPERATELLAMPGVAWNAGMFLWRRSAIRDALVVHARDIHDAIAAGLRDGDLAAAYAAVRATSIDYAVLEPASLEGRVVMGALDCGWSDLGSWSALLAELDAGDVDGRVVPASGTADVDADDLVVRRRRGRLVVEPGPGSIADEPGPVALLQGARRHHDIVDALVSRVAAGED
jgi:mannose-1-phosphate guanylyltransferase